MSDKRFPDLLLDSDDSAVNELWKTLGEAEHEEPSARLRQAFYQKLEQASRPTPATKLRNLLGFSGNAGWITATACLLAGLGAGQLLGGAGDDAGERLAALEQNVAMLNRSLVLDRLQNDEPGKRLLGVIDAAYLVAEDADIAMALLHLASSDRVDSIRSAAIEALGPQIKSPAIGIRLMDALQHSRSPMVQLALIDLVLRNGSEEQVGQLLEIAEGGLLFPDLQRHVLTSLGRETA